MVRSAQTKQKKENRPLLFSLTSLQSEANEKLGFSAATTLVTAQSLYEKKLLTYPRTDSNYITEDIAAQMAELVKMLRFYDENAVNELLLEGLNIDSRVVNKIDAHHAIIPTENIADMQSKELSEDEKAVLELVIKRLLAALSGEYLYNETEYIFEVNGENFKLKSKIPTAIGWKKFYPPEKDENNIIADYKEGESFEMQNLEIIEFETQPPKPFTEATLLRAMENIDRRIEDKELSEYVKKRGLGTPATRAGIIEEIIQNGYVERVKKTLRSTEFGRKLTAQLPENAKSVELTAEMEQKLSAIEKGEISESEVISKTLEMINNIMETEKTREHVSFAPKRERTSLGHCPKCGGEVYGAKLKNGSVLYFCENSSEKAEKPCIFRVFEDDLFWTSKKKKLGVKTLQTLLSKGKVKVSGLYSERTGNTYDAVISFGDDWTEKKTGKSRIGFKLEFDNKKKGEK